MPTTTLPKTFLWEGQWAGSRKSVICADDAKRIYDNQLSDGKAVPKNGFNYLDGYVIIMPAGSRVLVLPIG